MPLIFQIMDRLSNGKPVSSTYFDIWCRAYDECFVVLNRHQEMAFGAGFSGQRAEQTWQSRVGILAKWGFIDIKPGPSGPLSYAIVLNPYKVIEWHYGKQKPLITEELYNALLARAIEIGANDLTEEMPAKKEGNQMLDSGISDSNPGRKLMRKLGDRLRSVSK
jgi:hypothetical protein